MIGRLPLWLRVAGCAAVAALAAPVVIAFPWSGMLRAAVRAEPLPLALAFAASALSLAAKGWAWHLLMRPRLRSRWRTAQEANLVGAAVNGVSVALTGEAARLAYASARMGPRNAPLVGASIAWTRAAEGVGLAVTLSVVPLFLNLPAAWGRAQIAAAVLFWAGLAVLIAAPRLGLAGRLPRRARPLVRSAMMLGSPRRMARPVLLALVNWAAQWAAFHCVLSAVTPVTAAASFAALMAVNLGGLLRLLPANVGIVQASMVAGLAPFGVPAADAMAAGLLLQLVQVPPVIAAGAALVGVRSLRNGGTSWTTAPSMTST